MSSTATRQDDRPSEEEQHYTGGAALVSRSVNTAEAARIQRLAEAMSDRSPPWAVKYLRKAAPAIGVIGAVLEAIGPPLCAGLVGAYAAYQRLPRTVAKGVWGLGVAFFGGKYAASIAAAETFRSTGGAYSYQCLLDLLDQAKTIQAASAEDDKEDLDGDGIADVQQISTRDLGKRKMSLVLRKSDPEVITRAIGGLWSAYMGVLAVLQFQFAQTISLARSIGDNIRPMMGKILGPTLVQLTSPEYHQWISPSVNVSAKLLAVAFAWRIQTYLSTVHSGISGGLVAARALFQLLRERDIISEKDDDTCMNEILGYSIAATGIYVQLFKGGPVPYLLSPFFWPMDILEMFLRWNVTWISIPKQDK